MAKETTLQDLNVEREIIDMCDLAKEMFELTWKGFRRQNEEGLYRAEKIGRVIHEKEKVLTHSIMTRLAGGEGSDDEQGLSYIPSHLERIGDNIELLIRCTRTIIQEGICFSDKANKELNTLFKKADEILQITADAIKTKDKDHIGNIKQEGKRLQEIISDYSLSHYDRLSEGTCIPKASSSFLAIVDYLSEIEKHTRKIADRITS